MSIGNEPAYPVENFMTIQYGCTKRELFAAMAMQGILANPNYDAPRRTKLAGMAEDAAAAADALLAKLSKESP